MKVKIGDISVDAGICWIGDPCYILHADKLPDSVGKNWIEFVEKLRDDNEGVLKYKQFEHDIGASGLGVVCDTGYGDGFYPVFADIEDGITKSITIDFLCDDDRYDEDEDEDYEDEDYEDEDYEDEDYEDEDGNYKMAIINF